MKQFFIINFLIALFVGLNVSGQNRLKGFKPMLLKAEVSTDKLSPKDELVITATWQNIGSEPASQALKCFLEMEFGYQRTMENTNREYKYYWEPYPAMTQWKPGEIKTVSYRMNFPSIWGGTYKLFLGICDYENIHFDFIGTQNTVQKRQEIGEVDLGWSWGMAIIELTRKPWSKEFNQPKEIQIKESPVEKIQLTNNNLKVVFNAQKPALTEVNSGKETQLIKQLEPEVVFRDYLKDKVLCSYNKNAKVNYEAEKKGEDSLVYHGSVKYDGIEVAKFDIHVKLSGRDILLTLGNTWEAKDFELIEIKLFSLYSNANETTNIVSFLGGGRLIPLKTANPFGYCSPYDTRNAIGVYDQSGMVVLESTCLDDKVYTIVDETNGVKSAIVGASIATRVCGKKHVRSIEVPNVHSVRLSFPGEEWGEPSWMSVAKFLRKDLQGKGREKYKNSVFSLYYNNGGPEPEPWQVKEDSPYAITRLNQGLKFNEILPLMKNYSRLLDGYKQITKLYGWFKLQEDDRSVIGFPSSAVAGVDHRAGTLEELLNVFANSEKYNAKTQFYDNYDDFYMSPRNDSKMIAMDAEGNPWKGWIWADGQSYIIGSRKYWETGAALKRINHMIDQFKLKDMTHFDVLSSEVLRWDFDPEYPSSAHTSYLNKLNVVKEYNKYGIDVSSETLVHPYVGHISYCYHTRMNPNDRYFSGESFIYLIPAVYHGTIQYNSFAWVSETARKSILNSFITGGHYGFELDRESYDKIPWIYLQNMPINKLYDEKWENFSEKDGITTVKYTNNSSVVVDNINKRYEVMHKGRVIAKDWTTFTEGVKPGSYLAFSLDGGEMSYPAPKGWKDFSAIKAVTLTKTGEGNEVQCKIQNGQIVIDMPANTPVRITIRELSGQSGIDWKNVVFTGDLEYSATTSASGATSSLKLDVYRNSEKFGTKSPAILFVHGGGFAYGDKRQDLYVKMAVAFAARGYVAFSMNYSLKDEKEPHSQGILNRNVSQVLEAMKWIKSQASKFDIDTTQIFICGDSAGGGLAVNAGYSCDKGAGFAGCIDLWGGLPGKKIWDSPVYTGSFGKCVPPTCLIHGTSDNVVPYKSSQDLSDKLTAAGIYNELHPLENAKHYPENLSDVFIPIMMAFTDKVFTATGKPLK